MAVDNFFVACVRRRPGASSKNSKYESIITYTSTNINGYVGSRSNQEQKYSEKYTLKTQFKFYCDDFQLAYGDLIDYESKTYRVVSEPQNTVHANNHIKAFVERISNVN
jgi:hypothetical protein